MDELSAEQKAQQEKVQSFSRAQGSIVAGGNPQGTPNPKPPTPEPGKAPEGGQAGGQQGAQGTEKGGGTEFTPKLNDIWTVLKEKKGMQIPEYIEKKTGLPEGLTEEDVLIQTIANKAINSLPSDMAEYYENVYVKKITPEQFFKEKFGKSEYLSLPDDQYAIHRLTKRFGKSETNPEGWDEQKIQEEVDKMKNAGTLAIMAAEWKAAEKEQLNTGKSTKTIEQIRSEQLSNSINTVKSYSEELFTNTLKDKKEILGVPVTPEIMSDFRKQFEKIVTPDPSLGVSPFQIMINDNVMLANMVFGMLQVPNLIPKILSNANESTKKKLIDLLQLEPLNASAGSEPVSIEAKRAAFATAERS